VTLRGATVWILGFLAFVAGLNSINAILLLTQQGPEGMFTPYLIGNLTGDLSIATYLWISVLVTFVFLGMTLNSLVNKLPDPAVLDDITKKVDDLQNDQNVLSKLKTRLMIIDANIGEIRSGFVEGFGEQREGLKKMHGEFVNKFDKKLFDFKQEMAATLGKLEKATHESEQSDKRNMVTIKKQMKEIANIKLTLQELEDELAQPKPQLTSQSELRKVKGIGIGNVGELILTDPLIIAEKTG